jgi:hypothetical protein
VQMRPVRPRIATRSRPRDNGGNDYARTSQLHRVSTSLPLKRGRNSSCERTLHICQEKRSHFGARQSARAHIFQEMLAHAAHRIWLSAVERGRGIVAARRHLGGGSHTEPLRAPEPDCLAELAVVRHLEPKLKPGGASRGVRYRAASARGTSWALSRPACACPRA